MSNMAFRYWVYAGAFTGVQWLVQSPAVAFNTTAILFGVVPLFYWFNNYLENLDAKGD